MRHGKQEPRPAPELVLAAVPVPVPAPAPAPPRNPDAKKILIVDDDPEVVEVLRRFFEKTPQHYEVQTVTSGEDAIAALLLAPPDLVLLDLNMPA
ncbi:MAG: response regulator [Candidatus Rokubacteria bacterium]|nr:response regulator [Candidatus Rokubacteria bacterium]